MPIGFSTGAIALGDFRKALALLAPLDVDAVELSALRVAELSPLLAALDHLDLARFRHVSFHAPSRFTAEEEPRIVSLLAPVAARGWPIILHPDAVHDPAAWLPLEPHLCFENMDVRKPIGRTADELLQFLQPFPRSSVCLDVGHAHQVDPTMATARALARTFAPRIRQLHVSEVNPASAHVPLTATTTAAFQQLADLLDPATPIIIESVLPPDQLQRELARVAAAFAISSSRIEPHAE